MVHDSCSLFMMAKVLADSISTLSLPDGSSSTEYLRPIIKDAIRAEMGKRRRVFEDEGVGDETPLSLLLTIPLDFLAMPPSIAEYLLGKTFEEMIELLEWVAKDVLIDETLSLIKVGFSITGMPHAGDLVFKSRQQLFTESSYRPSTKGLNKPLNYIRELQGKVLWISSPSTNVIARYMGCANDKCRALEPFQHCVVPVFEKRKRYLKPKVPQCEQCRKGFVELTPLVLTEAAFDCNVYVQSWEKSVRVRFVGSFARLRIGNSYKFYGVGEADWETGEYYFKVLGLDSVDSHQGPAQDSSILLLSLRRFSNIESRLLPLKSARVLQMFRLLQLSARMVVLSDGDPWDLRICNTFYSANEILVGDRLTLGSKRRLSAILQEKSVMIVSPRDLKNLKIPMSEFDCVLDWRIRDGEEDRLIAKLILDGKANVWPCNSRLIPMFNGGSVRCSWATEMKQILQDYFVGFRKLCGVLNDHCRFPLHQPARQLTLLMEAAENAAQFAGRGQVQVEDVVVAVMIGEIVLEQRYGHNVLDDEELTYEINDGVMSPCLSAKYHRKALGPMVRSLRTFLCI